MDNQDIAASFRDKNNQLVPLLLARLHRYRKENGGGGGEEGTDCEGGGEGGGRDLLSRPFAEFGKENRLSNGSHAGTPTKNEAGSRVCVHTLL